MPSTDGQLKGKVAIVTGASRGIGEEIARLLAEQGAHVIVSSRKIADITGVIGGDITDATNAARTLLYDIHEGCWSAEICDLFGIPLAVLPEVKDCAADFGTTDPALFGAALPILGVAGDQQAGYRIAVEITVDVVAAAAKRSRAGIADIGFACGPLPGRSHARRAGSRGGENAVKPREGIDTVTRLPPGPTVGTRERRLSALKHSEVGTACASAYAVGEYERVGARLRRTGTRAKQRQGEAGGGGRKNGATAQEQRSQGSRHFSSL